ncbi:YncE family protein [Bacillus cereus]|uniref:YncE family protein n=1 Tax=Bacillus cereus TaxID=1396 RepID=UPI001D0D35B8|nr:YncE family protein [Bacillus cereus]
MSEKNEFESHEILYGLAFDPNLIGSKLPSIPPFTFPTGSTGSTGPTGLISTNRIYVTNVNDDNVSVISGATNAVISTIPVGSTRQGVGVNPFTNRIYISNANNDNASVIDGLTNSVIKTLSVGGLHRK